MLYHLILLHFCKKIIIWFLLVGPLLRGGGEPPEPQRTKKILSIRKNDKPHEPLISKGGGDLTLVRLP